MRALSPVVLLVVASGLLLALGTAPARAATIHSSIEWEVANSGFDSAIPGPVGGTNASDVDTSNSGARVSVGLGPEQLAQLPNGGTGGGPLPGLEGWAEIEGGRLRAHAEARHLPTSCDFGGGCGYASGTVSWSSLWNVTSTAFMLDDVTISAPGLAGLSGRVQIPYSLEGRLFDRSTNTQNLTGAMLQAQLGIQSVTRTVSAVAATDPAGVEELLDVESSSTFSFVFGEPFEVRARLQARAGVNADFNGAADGVTTEALFGNTLAIGPVAEVLADADGNGSFETTLTDAFTIASALGVDYAQVPEPGAAALLLAAGALAARRRAA